MTEPDAPGWQSPTWSGPGSSPATDPPAPPAPAPYGQTPFAVTAPPPYAPAPYAPAPYAAPPYAAPPYAPPPYGQQQLGQLAPPYGQLQLGPLGQVRSHGKVIGLTLVTLGIYAFVYNYKVHGEMQRHTGRGVGAGIALLLTLIAGVAMPFVTSSEVGSLYSRRGQRPPVNGWTGMWYLGSAIGGYVVFLFTIFAVAASTDAARVDASDDAAFGVAFGFAALLYLAVTVGGALVWFVKTNGALNRYWESLGVR